MGIDANVDAVCEAHQQRAQFGCDKYNTTTEREDFTTMDWVQHAQEEAMDGAVYLERLKTEVAIVGDVLIEVADEIQDTHKTASWRLRELASRMTGKAVKP